MPEKELLEEQLKQLDNLSIEELSDWRTETLPIISEIFNQNTSQYKQFINIGWYSMKGYTNKDLKEFKKCLEGMIKCLDLRKFQEQSNDTQNPSIIINNNPNFNQSQSQNQKQTLNIDNIIKDEIPSTRIKEIHEIVNSNEPKESKLNKITEILKKTGLEVVSSTLAKIISTSMGIF